MVKRNRARERARANVRVQPSDTTSDTSVPQSAPPAASAASAASAPSAASADTARRRPTGNANAAAPRPPAGITRIQTLSEADALAHWLLDHDRPWPVVVVSTAAGTDEPYIDVVRLKTEVGDLAEVVLIPTGDISWQFSAAMPEMTQVYGGASRVYSADQAWVADYHHSALRFAYSTDDDARVRSRLVHDALLSAIAAGMVDKEATPTTERVSGTVGGVFDSRAILALDDGRDATIWEEFAVPDVPLNRVVAPGMRVHGDFDPQTKRLDIRPALRAAPRPLLADLGDPGEVVLAEVIEVSASVVTLRATPWQHTVVPRERVTGNPLDDVSDLFSVGEIVLARLTITAEGMGLRLDDIDDLDDEPLIAPSLLPGGPPWLTLPPVRGRAGAPSIPPAWDTTDRRAGLRQSSLPQEPLPDRTLPSGLPAPGTAAPGTAGTVPARPVIPTPLELAEGIQGTPESAAKPAAPSGTDPGGLQLVTPSRPSLPSPADIANRLEQSRTGTPAQERAQDAKAAPPATLTAPAKDVNRPAASGGATSGGATSGGTASATITPAASPAETAAQRNALREANRLLAAERIRSSSLAKDLTTLREIDRARVVELAELRSRSAELDMEIAAAHRQIDEQKTKYRRADRARQIAQRQLKALRSGDGRGALEDAEQSFADPVEQFRHEVYLEWVRRVQPAEKPDKPLAPYTLSDSFLPSLEAVKGVSRTKVIAVVVEVLIGDAPHLASRELHRLRSGPGGDDAPAEREDGAVAWRVALQRNTPGARRLHYWRTADGYELSRIVLHDDMEP